MKIDKTKPVLVTGATGYVAGWLVKRLLEEGVTVHAAVRNPDDSEKLKYLNQAAENAAGSIKYFKSDLLEPGSYAEAMAGCELVFHTASPFITSVTDPQKELVEPAKNGTRNVLEEANRVESVKRVVVTSSCAAIYGDNIDIMTAPNETLTEEVWNTSSSLTHQPYSYSKTVAEHEAWTIAEQQAQWQLVTINPSLVMGPGINPITTSESFRLMKQFGDGTLKQGVPNVGIGLVDVRDVAEAHLQAGFKELVKGRYIVSGHNSNFIEIAKVLNQHYGDQYPIPTRILPKWLLWLLGPMVNKDISRKFVSRNIGFAWRADNSKSRKELGLSYRSLEDTLVPQFQQMIDHGVFNSK